MNRSSQAMTSLLFLMLMVGLNSKLVSAQAPAEDVILQWNRVLGQTLESGAHPDTILPARSFAIVNLAMFDAVNSIEGSHEPYLTDVPGSKNASIKASAAQAAHDVLVGLYPTRSDIYAAEFVISIEGEKFNRVQQGQRVGRIVAANMLKNRLHDGWSAPWTPFLLPPTPGNWQELFPGPYPGFSVFTNISGVTPFGLASGTQFLPPPPPSLDSAQYAADLNEIKLIGSVAGGPRTPDQTLTARLWAFPPISDGALFGVIFSTSVEQDLSTTERARLCALAFTSIHDALQTSFTSQYVYGRWRPITAIRRADEDNNPGTEADPAWMSLLSPFPPSPGDGTPPHPSYASNASSVSSSVAKILELFYQTDEVAFQIDFGPNGTRNYASFSELTNEIAASRRYGGVHFRYETDAGQQAGRNVASYIFANLMQPRDKH